MKDKRRRLLLISVIVLAGLLFFLFWRFKAKVGLVFPIDLYPLSLQGHQRLLVLAPHCDDETLGAAGVIQAALQAGMQVRVVIATNGDGFLFATLEEFRRLYPRHQDFIRMGNLRQQESLSALKVLGLSPEQVSFLSYPDRGTPALWEDNWSKQSPYHSPYSGTDRSPYPVTYDTNAVYAGEDYLADLLSILRSYQPDFILYPHPDDLHPDHWGLSAFTRLAVILDQHENPNYRPDTYAYLVHRPDFPSPKGLKPGDPLLPPPMLFDLDPNWYRFDLNQGEITLKGEAVKQYKSQLPLLHGLMESFIRTDEPFAQPQGAQLVSLGAGEPYHSDTWRGPYGGQIPPVQLDPAGDFFTRQLVPEADLVALYTAIGADNNLLVCAQMVDDTTPSLVYTLRVKAIGSNGVVDYAARNRSLQRGWKLAVLAGKYACSQVSLADLGQPWLVFVGANTKEGSMAILDQIAWQAVYVETGVYTGMYK
jgi:LmbE family N-acetylglucosaminyl deacetylase